ncbi:MAG: hypothetical protein J0I02_09370 [Alphaproteobacteria bacterium]|nr:hypothetical protein [Alphaproteobacteria bacterium]
MRFVSASGVLRQARPHGRLGVVLFALLAFALQSYTVQTHIHFSAKLVASRNHAADADQSKTPAADHNGDPAKPAKGDPANCPICQAMANAGAYITPAPAILALPSLAHFTIAIFVVRSVAIRPLSHSWYGRAPPVA